MGKQKKEKAKDKSKSNITPVAKQQKQPSLLSLDLYDFVMVGMIIFHVLLNPYTKGKYKYELNIFITYLKLKRPS